MCTPRRSRRTTVICLVFLAGLVIIPASHAEEQPDAVTPVREVIGRTGTLSFRPPGMPDSPDPARQIESVTVTQDLVKSTIGGVVTLRALPTATDPADIVLEFGQLNGAGCKGDSSIVAGSEPGSSPVAEYVDRTITIEAHRPAARSAEWNCAVAMLVESGGVDRYDVLTGTLTDELAPRAPELELKLRKQIVLRPGRWKKVRLVVSNPGTSTARNVRLRFERKRIRVRKVKSRLGHIRSGQRKARTIRVKLASKRPGRLGVRAAGREVEVETELKVFPPIRFGPSLYGRYESISNDPGVRFRITRNHNIAGFRIYMAVTCGVSPRRLTTTYRSYHFPRVRIPASGRVEAADSNDRRRIRFKATLSGGRVKRGYFSYHGPNYCFGSERWTARNTD